MGDTKKLGKKKIKIDTINNARKLAEWKQYLVEGARLMCVNGGSIVELKLPEGHGYFSGGRKKANCKDCIACKNIPHFGICCKNEKTHQCEGFMELEKKWINTEVSAVDAEQIDGESAISMSSVLLCKKGGIIIPVTSGQEYDGEVNWVAFMKRYMKVSRWVAGKNLLCQVYGKDPINMNTGNYIYEKETLSILGIVPLSFKMFYNAMDCVSQGNLGEGWSHNYSVHLKRMDEDNILIVTLEDGREVPYRRELGDKYISVMGDSGTLEKLKDGFHYIAEKLCYIFDLEGKMISQMDANGNRRFFLYNQEGLLDCVENGRGSKLKYIYNQERMLIYVEDHAGRKIRLGYQYGKLRWFTDTDGDIYTYNYNVNGKLSEIITPDGLIGVKNEYDGANRVVKQTTSDNGVVEFQYDDKKNRTYLMEQNGNLLIYECDEKMRNIRTIYEDGEETYGYNDRNQKIYYTDKNGSTTRYSYDNHGNLTQVINALRQKTSMTYDKNDNLICIKRAGYGSQKFKYDRNGNCIEIEADGGTTRIRYGEDGTVDKIIQPDGSEIQYLYDENGNVIHISSAMGGMITYKYDTLNRIVESIDGNGNIRKYKYNTKNKLVSVTNPIGKKKKFVYDGEKLISFIDYDNNPYKIEYSNNKPCKYINSEGNTVLMEYDQMGNLIKEESPLGKVTKYYYNKLNQLETIKDGEESKIQFIYDKNGNRIKIIDQDGYETKFKYDACNRIVNVYEPDGYVISYEYNLQGKIQRVTFNYEKYIEISYDLYGRKVKEKDIYGRNTSYAYNQMGKLKNIIRDDGLTTSLSYYPGGLLKKIQYPDGTFECYNYDDNANLIEKSNQNGYICQYEYDSLDRVIKITSNLGEESSYEYDAIGRVISVKDGNGNKTHFSYSNTGKLNCVIDALGNEARYEYDKADNLISAAQYSFSNENTEELSRSNFTMYKRDLHGKLKSIIDEMGNCTNFEYDKYGNVTRILDADGYQTEYKYNIFNKISEINYNNEKKAKFIYDSNRNLVTIDDWNGTFKLDYDNYGRVISVTDYKGEKLSYKYNEINKIDTIIYPDEYSVNYQYDNFCRLSEIKADGWRSSIKYDSCGNIKSKTMGNGFSINYTYDMANRLLSFINTDPNNKVLDKFIFNYDTAGNKINVIKERMGLKDINGNYNYYYDSLNQLTGIEKDGNLIRYYRYDGYGNRVYMNDNGKETYYYYNNINQLVRKKEEGIVNEYLYDKRGNLIKCLKDGEVDSIYEFDGMNRLTRFTGQNGNSELYNYNSLGHRVRKTITTENGLNYENYVVDITRGYNNLLYMESESEIKDFIWDYQLAGTKDSGESSYYFLDEFGSPLRYITNNGKKLESNDYDEFGRNRKHSVKYIQPFGFAGYLGNGEDGRYYANAREYFSEFGRFLSRDPYGGFLGASATLNYYNYCFLNPLRYIDPTGYFTSAEGNEAHLALQGYFLGKYPGNAQVEVSVQGYKYSKTGEGYIDMLLTNNAKGEMEVYEIKPITQRNKTIWQIIFNKPSGVEQRQGYIEALKFGGKRVDEKGTTFNPNGLMLPSTLHPDKMIKYYTYTEQPGMIYYGYVNKPKPDPQEEYESEFSYGLDLEEKKEQAILGVKTGLVIYGLYRLIRLLPSVFCPPTLVPNLACP